MRILGIDPGYAIVGFGVLDYDGNKFKVVEYGAITTNANENMFDRLKSIYDDACNVIDRVKPDFMAIEELFFNSNQKTAINVAQARGVLLLAAMNNGLKEVPKPDDTADAVAIAICHGHSYNPRRIY